MKKLKDLKVGDKFYYVNNGLGVCIVTATNVLDCMSNECMKVEMTCGDARWPSIYGWRERSSLCDDRGTFYFDKEEVVELLQDTIDDLKTTLKSFKMETNFNSQICTTKEQSERLLALGLKKEIADCYWFYCDIAKEWKCAILSSTQVFKDYPTTIIPAWSLGRLIKDLMPQSIGHLELAVGGDYVGYYEDRCESESGMWWEYSSETSDMFNNIISLSNG